MTPSLLPYPATWPAPPRGPVLVLAPHADDEVIGCGGAIALHVAQDDAVTIAIATDGMLGDPEGRFTGRDYRDMRASEARAAAAALGAPPPELWGFPDQGLRRLLALEDGGAGAGADSRDDAQPVTRQASMLPQAAKRSPLVAAILRAIENTRAATIYGPPARDMHPDHQALGAALLEALASLRVRETSEGSGHAAHAAPTGHGDGSPEPRPRAFVYEVWARVEPTHVLDVSSVWEQKERALRAYESQLAYMDLTYMVRGLNAARAVFLPRARYVEAFAEIL